MEIRKMATSKTKMKSQVCQTAFCRTKAKSSRKLSKRFRCQFCKIMQLALVQEPLQASLDTTQAILRFARRAQFLDVDEITPGGQGVGEFSGSVDGIAVFGQVSSATNATNGFLPIGDPTDWGSTIIDDTSPQFSFQSSYAPTNNMGDKVGYNISNGSFMFFELQFDSYLTDLSLPSGVFDAERNRF